MNGRITDLDFQFPLVDVDVNSVAFVHCADWAAQSGFRRSSNNAGGLEGGVTNGQPVIVRAAMKPLSTLRTPLKSVDLATKEAVEAVVERSDVCAVPAAGIVGEAMMAIVLAQAFLDKFGGDSIDEIRRNHAAYLDSLKRW